MRGLIFDYSFIRYSNNELEKDSNKYKVHLYRLAFETNNNKLINRMVF